MERKGGKIFAHFKKRLRYNTLLLAPREPLTHTCTWLPLSLNPQLPPSTGAFMVEQDDL